MRFVYALAVILLTACATTVAQNKSIPITVIGEGSTINDAKNNAFQKAIEQEVGIVLLSHKKVQNNKLSKDEIISHSSGYVQDYKIQNTEKIDNTYYLTVDVFVKSSKIAERVLGVSDNEPQHFDGQKLNDTIVSYSKSRDTGDQLLASVLSDYPYSAFVIEKPTVSRYEVQVVTDKNRNIIFNVPVRAYYNYNFVKSLKEALSITGDKKIAGNTEQQKFIIKSIKPGSFRETIGLSETDTFYINETSRADLIKKYFDTSVSVRLEALDLTGKKLFHVCEEIEARNGAIYQLKYYEFYSSAEYKGTIQFFLKHNDPKIKEINSFGLSIFKGTC